ncbi:hypothetical protein BDR05DRAFT_14020 [Suillus weaverae]|nr:hypothetical protein BDR05DRAFT_14020 [Suillus weaverae]
MHGDSSYPKIACRRVAVLPHEVFACLFHHCKQLKHRRPPQAKSLTKQNGCRHISQSKIVRTHRLAFNLITDIPMRSRNHSTDTHRTRRSLRSGSQERDRDRREKRRERDYDDKRRRSRDRGSERDFRDRSREKSHRDRDREKDRRHRDDDRRDPRMNA